MQRRKDLLRVKIGRNRTIQEMFFQRLEGRFETGNKHERLRSSNISC